MVIMIQNLESSKLLTCGKGYVPTQNVTFCNH